MEGVCVLHEFVNTVEIKWLEQAWDHRIGSSQGSSNQPG